MARANQYECCCPQSSYQRPLSLPTPISHLASLPVVIVHEMPAPLIDIATQLSALLNEKQRDHSSHLRKAFVDNKTEYREVPLTEQEDLVLATDMPKMEKLRCMMTSALQRNDPWEVFHIGTANGIKKGMDSTADIFLHCAAQLIDVDEMLKPYSITPPPPTSIPDFPLELTPFRFAPVQTPSSQRTDANPNQNQDASTSNYHPTPDLSPETIHRLSTYFELFGGRVTIHEARELAEECNVTADRVKKWFKNRRAQILRRQRKQETTQPTNQDAIIRTTPLD